MKRVMIIGSPGTGKSTFARKLANKTGLPLIHLDFYYHDKSKNYYEDKDAWKAQVEELTAQDEWVIDGNYGKTMSSRMSRADTIFYFDMPRRVALRGVVKRRLAARHTKREDMPDDWKETANLALFKYVWGFRKKYKAGTQQLLDENKGKQIIIFSNHKQTGKYLKDAMIEAK